MLVSKLLELEDISAWEDALSWCRGTEKEGSKVISHRGQEEVKYNEVNFATAHEEVKKIRARAAESVRTGGGERAVNLYKKCLLFDAPFEFDAAIRYAEFDRPPKRRFYEPRRKQLLQVVEAMQDLEERKIKRLLVALPPGTGKTTLAEFFMVWSGNRHPELSIFGASHNSEFLKGVWTEIDRMLDPEGEYLWHEIFPDNKVVSKSAKNLRIDLNASKRFETFEFSPVGAGSAGKVRATNLIYCDDLVSGIEEALSTQRMEQLWQKYSTDVLSRTLGDEWVELMIQTPWSIHDPIDRLELKYMNDPETKIIKIPALNAKGQSNFNYKYGLGHSTKSLNQIKSTLDDASWRAVYMMEPVERMGQLYAPDEMQYYIDLPEGEPDAVYAVCDTKEQGLDYCVCPVVYQYGNQYFVEDFICDNGKVELLEERVSDLLLNHKVSIAQFESNRGGTTFARNVGEKLKNKGGHTTIKTKWNQTNKETRILARSGMVKQMLLFKDESTQNKEYALAMRLLFGYTMLGSAKHRKDDVPDALSMMIDFLQGLGMQKVRIGRRFF